MDKATLRRELLLAVIRGALPISALEDAGIQFELEQSADSGAGRQLRIHVENAVVVEPKPVDIASGLLAYKQDPAQLRTWATFVMGASELIDLSDLDKWPEGDELLTGLWDASFEGSLKPETERLALALTEG